MHAQFNTCVAKSDQKDVDASRVEAPVSSSDAPVLLDDTAIFRRFVDDAGVIGQDEGPMMLSEMCTYVRGSTTRQGRRRHYF